MKPIPLFIAAICLSINLLAQAPQLQWAKAMGGTNMDKCFSGVVDVNGNVYTTGWFYGTATSDFDPGAGVYNLTPVGDGDIFISKLDANGNFVWAKTIGGSQSENGFSIELDADGNIYTTGWFWDTVDFDPGIATYNLISTGGEDIFISKLDSMGNFVWAKSIVGSFNGSGASITTDSAGNVYATGYFDASSDFDPGSGIYNLTSAGNWDIFILKLDANGNFVWAKRIGDSEVDAGYSVKVDSGGNILITGIFDGTVDFDPGAGIYNLISAGYLDIFICKLNSNGNFVWAKNMGGKDYDYGMSIVTDAQANVYSTGSFSDTADFDPGIGIYNLISHGENDIFISKLNAAGNFLWAKNIGHADFDGGNSLVLDSVGNVYITGSFQDTVDFNPGAGIFNLISAGYSDIFISKFDSSGSFVWAKSIAGEYTEESSSIALDAGDNIYITGSFVNTIDFNPPLADTLTSHGYADIFVAKYSQTGVGIAENNILNQFHLFPNPTNGDFTIHLGHQYEDVSLSIFNLTGQCVFNSDFHNTNILNVSFAAPTGIYFVEVKSFNMIVGRMKVFVFDKN